MHRIVRAFAALAAAALLNTPSSAQAALPAPVHHWPGDGNAGDVVGTAHGTLVNGATFTPGQVGEAFSFDGANDAAAFPPGAAAFGTSDFTVAFWIRTTSTRFEGVLGNRPQCFYGFYFDIRIGNGILHAEIYGGFNGQNGIGLATTHRVNDGRFHLVALVRQGVQAFWYVDGALSRASAPAAAPADVSSGSSLVAGRSACTDVDGTSWFTGQLDEVKLYDRALPGASDNVPPTIVGTASPQANPAGWNNTGVSVSFECFDELSAIASCTSPVTLSGEGTNLSATGTAVDHAGNAASTTLGGINIDRTAPSVEMDALAPLDFPLPAAAVTGTAADALSGLDRVAVRFVNVLTGSAVERDAVVSAGGTWSSSTAGIGTGVWEASATSTDLAGNVSAPSTTRTIIVLL